MIENCLNILGVDDLDYDEQVFVLDEITKYIFDIKEKYSTSKKTFDLNLDYKYYFPDFYEIGINLNKDDISWWEFDTLLDSFFRKENSSISIVMNYRLYEKPPENPKTQKEKEHRFRLEMKRKYALIDKKNINDGLEKLWNYVEQKAGETKEC